MHSSEASSYIIHMYGSILELNQILESIRVLFANKIV